MHVFRKALTAVVALAAFSGLGAAAAPAQAATYCSTKGQKYVCDYGIATTKFANGTKEEFVVGADHAVWTNWTYPDGSWNGWQSMGGWVQSRIRVDAQQQTSTSSITITAVGQDGNDWFRLRHPDGSWTDWRVSCLIDPNNQICA
ncbi:hypothetical protein OG529_36095 (plasmid) [Streptomyces longwoodensis]|uniref:hypothetical protein n=1 Tax=Streptomyces longwoodensis TaxID=68231 RepID=UPI002F916E4E